MLGRIGAVLLVAGAVASVVAVAIAAGGGSIGVAGRNSPPPTAGEIVTLVAIVLFGLGSGALSLAGAAPFQSRTTRVGLGLVGVGLLSQATGSILPSFFGVYVESYPIWFGLLGFALGTLGLDATGASLIRGLGLPRLAGFGMFGGLIGLIVSLTGALPVIDAFLVLLLPLSFALIAVAALTASLQPQ